MKKTFLLLVLLCLFICGCSSDGELISYNDAKEMIVNDNAILLDVRTEEEYNEHHLDGALLLTLDTIDENTASKVISSKDKEVIVYCKSGVRSSQAKEKLTSLGYNNVYDLGSIDNWKE